MPPRTLGEPMSERDETGTGADWDLDITSGSERPIQGWYSATVNHKKKNSTAVFSTRQEGSSSFAWVLLPARGLVPPATARLENPSLSHLTLVVDYKGVSRRIRIPFDHGEPVVAVE